MNLSCWPCGSESKASTATSTSSSWLILEESASSLIFSFVCGRTFTFGYLGSSAMVRNGTTWNHSCQTKLVPTSTNQNLAIMEPFGTIDVMAKPKAVKFYVQQDLMEACEHIFSKQGVNLSEGMTRLIRCLAEGDPELWPILLMQAPGDAPKALATYILKKKPNLMRIAGKKLK